MTKKIKVVFSRSYEIDLDKIKVRGKHNYSPQAIESDEEVQKEIAEDIARDLLEEELPYIVTPSKDFFSSSFKKII